MHHLVPSGNMWARRLGVPATRSTIPLETVELPTSGYINFQTANASPGTFEGKPYRADTGLPYGNRGANYWYGWSGDNAKSTRNRNNPASADERFDTLAHMQNYGSFFWEVAVPNGLYQVRIVAGDANFIDSIFSITAEGIPVVVGIPMATRHWLDGTALVVVMDGRLTVRNGAGSSNNKICFVDYSLVTPPNHVTIQSLSHSLSKDEVIVTLDLRQQ